MMQALTISGFTPVQRSFENWAAKDPRKPAITHEGTTISYAELNNWSNRIEQTLTERGIRAGARVGLYVGRSPEFAASMLAILKCGAACVPLDTEYPADRIDYMLRDSSASAVLGAKHSLPGLRTVIADLPLVCIQPVPATGGSNYTHPNTARSIDPLSPALVLYTSGSTGPPKGVLISHQAVSHYLAALANALAVRSDERYLHTASFAFSSSNRQLLLPLICGGAIVLASPSDLNDPLALFQLVRVAKVTIIDLIPSRLRSYMTVLERMNPRERSDLFNNDLRLVLTASEPLWYDIANTWREVIPKACRMVNMYGMTETSGIVSVYELDHDTGSKIGAVPIGLPIAGVKFRLGNADDTPPPADAVGELCIEGPTLAAGYTDGRNGVFANSAARRRLVRTGDRARLRNDGCWELLGRIDEQIKIQGARIEPAEIEQALIRHPAVRDCAVAGWARSGGVGLTAFYVSDHILPPDALGEFVRRFLPDHMVPAQFHRLSALPRTLSGKIDRVALSPLLVDALPVTSPRTPFEARLFEIWSAALQRSDFGVFCNFFELGGKSIALHEVNARVLQEFDVRLHASAIYRLPCIADLANHIEQSTAVPAGTRRETGKL
jgi:amino acid adenylation domain-containing protein